jgi:hypothetical protein
LSGARVRHPAAVSGGPRQSAVARRGCKGLSLFVSGSRDEVDPRRSAMAETSPEVLGKAGHRPDSHGHGSETRQLPANSPCAFVQSECFFEQFE